MKPKAKSKDRYIVNGKTLHSFDDVEAYANELGLRITNTETLRKGVVLISLNK